jgi:hypothetical protein
MPLFCLHAEFSSDVDHHNSITSKPASRQSHMVKKLGDLPKFFVFNSGTKSFRNGSVSIFFLQLSTFIQLSVFALGAFDRGLVTLLCLRFRWS